MPEDPFYDLLTKVPEIEEVHELLSIRRDLRDMYEVFQVCAMATHNLVFLDYMEATTKAGLQINLKLEQWMVAQDKSHPGIGAWEDDPRTSRFRR